MKTVFPECTCL